MRKALQLILYTLGLAIVILCLFSLWKRNDPARLQFDNVSISVERVNEEGKIPSGIEIRDIGVSLPVIPAYKNGNKWDTTPDGVSHLVTSPIPGEQGNSILYGHNWGSILGNLHKVRIGQKIDIYYSDGTKNEFEIMTVNEVSPGDPSLLAQTDEKIVTLYTCSGLFDQKRLVVTAVLL